MTCKHCVGAESIFYQKEARKQFKRYQKKGPKKVSKKLIQALLPHVDSVQNVLDIGAGIGAVHLEMMKKGVASSTDVDASSSYIAKSKEAGRLAGFGEKVVYMHGDFLDVHMELEKHDLVVMDKVICCYPNVEDLLEAAIQKSNKFLALTFPKSNWIGKIFIVVGNLYFNLTKNPFRTHLHNNLLVRNKIQEAGFKPIFQTVSYPWNVEVYSKN